MTPHSFFRGNQCLLGNLLLSITEGMRIYHSTLSTEAEVSSETLTVTYKTTRYHNTADLKIGKKRVVFLNLFNLTRAPDVICSCCKFRFYSVNGCCLMFPVLSLHLALWLLCHHITYLRHGAESFLRS